MAMITAEQVKELRERTGIGMMECKKALEEADCDMERPSRSCARRATPGPRTRPSGRPSEGLIGSYIHMNGQDRRPGRGQLRDRLRGPQRGVQGAGQEHGHAHRRLQPEIRRPGRRPGRGPGAGEGHRPRTVQGLQEAARDRREDRRGQADQVLRGSLPPRAALHQGRQDQDQGPGHPVHRQVQGKHQDRPVRPLTKSRSEAGHGRAQARLSTDPAEAVGRVPAGQAGLRHRHRHRGPPSPRRSRKSTTWASRSRS